MRNIYTQIIKKLTLLSIRFDNGLHGTKRVNLDILQLGSMKRSFCELGWGNQKMSSLTNMSFIDPTMVHNIYPLPSH